MFTVRLSGAPIGAPWEGTDWDGDNDWEFTSAAGAAPEQLYELWDGARRQAALASPADGQAAAGPNGGRRAKAVHLRRERRPADQSDPGVVFPRRFVTRIVLVVPVV
jgi:hypothetical protein